MTEDEAVAMMQEIIDRQKGHQSDIENDHLIADGILCQLLIELGFDEVVKKYQEIDKWYA